MNRGSRRAKLDSYAPEHLVLCARYATMVSHHTDDNRLSVNARETLLRSAAERGNEEATWLLSVIERAENSMEISSSHSEDRRDVMVRRCTALGEALIGDDSPRGRFCCAHALRDTCDEESVTNLLRQSAEAGFAPAMSALAEILRRRDDAEGSFWARKAAEQCDPDGLAIWTDYVEDAAEKRSLLTRSAALGSLRGLICLAYSTTDRLQRNVLWAKILLLTGDEPPEGGPAHPCARRLRDGHTMSPEDIELLYFVGKELEGFEVLWAEGSSLSVEQYECVEVYLTVMDRARRAALQAVLGLRQVGLLRDLAVMIAQHVYRTREDDPYAWFPALGKKRK